ncbi:MAG: hypothetical protein AB7N65_13155 [Vicinamibacterales bacterium]
MLEMRRGLFDDGDVARGLGEDRGEVAPDHPLYRMIHHRSAKLHDPRNVVNALVANGHKRVAAAVIACHLGFVTQQRREEFDEGSRPLYCNEGRACPICGERDGRDAADTLAHMLAAAGCTNIHAILVECVAGCLRVAFDNLNRVRSRIGSGWSTVRAMNVRGCRPASLEPDSCARMQMLILVGGGDIDDLEDKLDGWASRYNCTVRKGASVSLRGAHAALRAALSSPAWFDSATPQAMSEYWDLRGAKMYSRSRDLAVAFGRARVKVRACVEQQRERARASADHAGVEAPPFLVTRCRPVGDVPHHSSSHAEHIEAGDSLSETRRTDAPYRPDSRRGVADGAPEHPPVMETRETVLAVADEVALRAEGLAVLLTLSTLPVVVTTHGPRAAMALLRSAERDLRQFAECGKHGRHRVSRPVIRLCESDAWERWLKAPQAGPRPAVPQMVSGGAAAALVSGLIRDLGSCSDFATWNAVCCRAAGGPAPSCKPHSAA